MLHVQHGFNGVDDEILSKRIWRKLRKIFEDALCTNKQTIPNSSAGRSRHTHAGAFRSFRCPPTTTPATGGWRVLAGGGQPLAIGGKGHRIDVQLTTPQGRTSPAVFSRSKSARSRHLRSSRPCGCPAKTRRNTPLRCVPVSAAQDCAGSPHPRDRVSRPNSCWPVFSHLAKTSGRQPNAHPLSVVSCRRCRTCHRSMAPLDCSLELAARRPSGETASAVGWPDLSPTTISGAVGESRRTIR